MDETQVNIPLLRKAVEWAEVEAAKPEEFSQWWQGDYSTSATSLDRDQSCGTCYCIAGFVALQMTGKTLGGEAHDVAAHHLGLDPTQAEDLFDACNTIEGVRRIAEEIAGERL